MSRVDVLRALVRPVCVIYCTVILGILAIMCTAGYALPAGGSGSVIVNTFIGITATVTTEYTIERGVKKYLERKK
jgi:hypothetical protein